MKSHNQRSAAAAILRQAKSFGATLAGIASIDDLKRAPSFTFAPLMPGVSQGIGARKSQLGLKPGEVAWPPRALSILVIAVEHPADKPEMDWWFGRVDPPGNRILARVVQDLCQWIPETFGIQTVHLPYHVEKGGTYLKDAAVLAGLGCVGRNNILVTPEFGPRVRLRALTLDTRLPPTGPSAFDPCRGCGAPCRKACPQRAFDTFQYEAEAYGQNRLPGRDGAFARATCNVQMELDNTVAKEQHVEGFDAPVKIIRYCRACELSCPVGR